MGGLGSKGVMHELRELGKTPIWAFLAAGACALGVYGGWTTYVAVHDGRQVEMSCADYFKHRPEGHWLKLTGCEFDVNHYAVYSSTKDGAITAVYFPTRATGENPDGKTRLVVVRDDRAMLDVINAYEHGVEPSQEELASLEAQASKPIEGLVSFGLDVEHNRELADLHLNLDSDFVILRNGTKPDLKTGIEVLAGSFACLLGAIFFFRIHRQWERSRPRPPPPSPRVIDPKDPVRSFEENV